MEIESTLASEESVGDETFVLDNRLNKFQELFSMCIENVYSPTVMLTWSDEEIHTFFMVLNHINFYAPTDASLLLFSKFVSEISEDNSNHKNYRKQLEQKLWKGWQFDELQNYKLISGESSTYIIPEIKSKKKNQQKGHKYLRVTNPKLLYEDYIDLSSGNFLVVVGSTLCSPSKRFTSWYEKRAEELQSSEFSVVWLTKQFEESRFSNVYSFNKEHTHIEYNFVQAVEDWPFITYWGTPTIYFLSDGKLVAQIVGWPAEGRENQVFEKINEYFAIEMSD
uniref:hypothetical protein n=1 Tax=Ningiella ruwaisensis TaxID=2364274 RepID=UPI00109F57F1|nr:hypothetical protein [Ningiella ruwaisensis]